MLTHQMSLMHLAFFLCCQFFNNFPEIFSKVSIYYLFSGTSESKPDDTCNPTWYDLNFLHTPSKASSYVIFERFTYLEASVYFRNCQTLRVSPAEPGVYPIKLFEYYINLESEDLENEEATYVNDMNGLCCSA